MTNWALVIGVDDYSFPGAQLYGAVSDAIAMRDWLWRDDGGGVPKENLVLALGPRAGSQHAAVDAFPGTVQGMLDAVQELIQRNGGTGGDRLYVHYSGHGIAARIGMGWSEEHVLVGSDFTPAWTTRSFAVRSLVEYFGTFPFLDQFFFIDACRNIPWEGDIAIGQWPWPYSRTPGTATVQQLILRSTSPGLTAVEAPDELGNERGAFTQVLLAALLGEGAAKVWDPALECYPVNWDRLVGYVKRVMEDRRIEVDTEAGRIALQIPQENTTRGAAGRGQNPAVVTFPADHFAPHRLLVRLEPADALPVAEVEVRDEVTAVVGHQRVAVKHPAAFELPPKTYGVKAEAPAYDLALCRPPVDLYESREVRLTLAHTQPPDADTADGATERDTELLVTTADALTPVEITDVAGRPLKSGEHAVRLAGLEPGIYRARATGPDGQLVEQLVELSPGEAEHVPLEPPEPPSEDGPVAALVRTTDLALTPDGALVAADALGPIAAPHVSTIMTLAAGVAVHRGELAGAARLESLGLGGAQERLPADATSGLYVLFGANDAGEAAADIRLRWWPIGELVPAETFTLEPATRGLGIGEYASAATPGAHWLSIERAVAAPALFAITVLPRRVMVLVLVRDDGDQLRAFQFSPSMDTDAEDDLRTLRRVELLQRCQAQGQLSAGVENARELLRAKFLDPLAGCLGGYLMLRLGRAQELGHAVRNLTARFGGLSDVHILRAEYEAHRGRHADAREAYGAAVAAGVPMVGEGLTRLLDGLQEHRISHDNGRRLTHVHQRYLHGQLWLAWTPDRLVAGLPAIPEVPRPDGRRPGD